MTRDQPQNEVEFIAKLKSETHREQAFSKLIDQYQERLYWHIRKIVGTHENANDVLQNTFFNVIKGIQKFKGKSSLHTWMYRIAYNESIRFLNKNKKFKNNHSIDEEIKYLNTLPTENLTLLTDANTELQIALTHLTDYQRSVFSLKYFDELTFKEMAKLLNKSENTLKSAYYAAVKQIENHMKTIEF